MSSTVSNINFSFEYAVSIIVVLVVCNLLVKTSPQMNTVIVIIAGLVVGWISLIIMNTLFPSINQLISNIYQYYSFQLMNNFNSMGYMNVWPPILAILIIFIVLLYNRQLG
jgi:ABC-type Fe3+-siderophore transport system permease subunit